MQLARHEQTHVIVSPSAANMDFMKGLGADKVIDLPDDAL